MNNLTDKTTDYEAIIFEVLKDLGISPGSKGYIYTKYIVQGFLSNKLKESDSICYVIYPKVAKHFEVENVARIERCIRHAIEECLKNAPMSVVEKYFGNTLSYSRGKLTNKQFLYTLAEYIRIYYKDFS